MTTRSSPDFDGVSAIYENETTTKFSDGLKETQAAAIAKLNLYNPPLCGGLRQLSDNLQG